MGDLLEQLDDFIFHRHHHHHEPDPDDRIPKYFDIEVLEFHNYRTKDNNMSSETLIDGQSTVGTVGQTTDTNGQATADPVSSGSVVWSVDSPLITVTPAADTLSATFAAPAGIATGVVNVTATATTDGGVAVTGAGVLNVNAPPVGPPATFAITFSPPV